MTISVSNVELLLSSVSKEHNQRSDGVVPTIITNAFISIVVGTIAGSWALGGGRWLLFR